MEGSVPVSDSRPIRMPTVEDDPETLTDFLTIIQDLSERLEALRAEVRDARSYAQRLWIRSRSQISILSVDEVEWIEADAKYCRVHTRDATHRLREPIGRLEERLDPARFARIHRSAIVNLDRVVEVLCSAGSSSVVLKDGTRIPISRPHKLRVLELAGEAQPVDSGVVDPAIR